MKCVVPKYVLIISLNNNVYLFIFFAFVFCLQTSEQQDHYRNVKYLIKENLIVKVGESCIGS